MCLLFVYVCVVCITDRHASKNGLATNQQEQLSNEGQTRQLTIQGAMCLFVGCLIICLLFVCWFVCCLCMCLFVGCLFACCVFVCLFVCFCVFVRCLCVCLFGWLFLFVCITGRQA